MIFSIERLIVPWAPVIFGLVIFAPMLSAVMNEFGIFLPYNIPNILASALIGVVWGYVAKSRDRWL
jgi:hypothetical protein